MSEMANRARWGILATGWIADIFTRDLLLTNHAVAAVGSRTQDSARQFAERFGIAAAHGSYESLVTDPTVDVVYIATPHPYHFDAALMALNAGKHILVEKPFMLNGEQAAEVVGLARQKGLVVLEAMWTRFLPHMTRIRELVRSGAIGDVRGVIADHTQKLPDAPEHRLNSLALGGGALLDLGIYPISFAWELLGKPAEIASTATFRRTGADAQVSASLRYSSGAVASTFSSSEVAGPNRASIIGTRGRIEIDPVWYRATSFRLYDNEDEVLENFSAAVEGRGMSLQADHLEELLEAGEIESSIMPPIQSVEIMRGLDLIREQIGLRYPGEKA